MGDTIASGGIDRRSFLRSTGLLAAALAVPGTARSASRFIRDGAEPISLASVRPGRHLLEVVSSFDCTEHGHDGWIDVVLWPGDRGRLERMGVPTRILVEDLIAVDLQARAAEQQAQLADPSQRLMYRTLADYESELAALGATHPTLVRPLSLPHTTFEGRTVHGIEIAHDVASAATDGRPVSFVMGLHHAREWPSAELTMDLAHHLVSGYTGGDPTIVDLLRAIRVFIVPVVNPDGYVRSRETISDFIAPLPGAAAFVPEFSYHRKNMRTHDTTLQTGLGRGVDPNRNYPHLWSGDGSEYNPGGQTYHGPGPASEPEVRNIVDLVRANQVVTLITNHTFGNLILRPWGHIWDDAPDEPALRDLGAKMAAHNGYRSQKGIGLYPTTGTTDDWHYAANAALSYTFEIGTSGQGFGNTTPVSDGGFHPQYNLWIPTYRSLNMPAFMELLNAARDASLHGVLQGTAQPGTEIRVRKEFTLPYSFPHEGRAGEAEVHESRAIVGPSGSFEIHVNPSPLPETVAAVRGGHLPSSAKERYTVIATRPDQSASTQHVLVERGTRTTVVF